MVEYGTNQERLSKQIDKEFYERQNSLRIAHYLRAAGCYYKPDYAKGITIVSVHPCDISHIDSTVDTTLVDIERFQVGSPSTYTKVMLERAGIYGFAICAKGDEFDRDFGELVAKARLLKHLKKSGLVIK